MFFVVCCFFLHTHLFLNILSGIPSECQTVWIQIRSDILSGLTWVQAVCISISRGHQYVKSKAYAIGNKISCVSPKSLTCSAKERHPEIPNTMCLNTVSKVMYFSTYAKQDLVYIHRNEKNRMFSSTCRF